MTDETVILAVLTAGAEPDRTLTAVIGASTNGAYEQFVDHVLVLPAIGPLEPLLANVYFQLFAYHVANEKDRPIDKPRHLVKRVTGE